MSVPPFADAGTRFRANNPLTRLEDSFREQQAEIKRNERIPSFTERGLLNTTALNILCPPNCEEYRIKDPHNSVIDTIVNAKTNPFARPMKTSWVHKGMKPIRLVARMVYTLAVSLILGTLGTLWYGVRAFYHWRHSHSATANALSKPLFVDLTSALYGCAFLCVGAYWKSLLEDTYYHQRYAPLGSRILVPAMVVSLFVGTAMYFSQTHRPAKAIAQQLAYGDHRTGMYLSLAVRNELGICGPNGGILPFGEKDRLIAEERRRSGNSINYQFIGNLVQQLGILTIQAELELLDKVREANASLSKNNLAKIPYVYPLNGNTVAKQIESNFNRFQLSQLYPSSRQNSLTMHDASKGKLLEIAQKIRMYQRKISILRNLIETTQKICIEPSPQMTLFYLLAKQSPPSVTVKMQKSYVNQGDYKAMFNLPYMEHGPSAQQPSGQQSAFTDIFTQNDLPAVDPDLPTSSNKDTYETFKYKIQTVKWKVENHEQLDSLPLDSLPLDSLPLDSLPSLLGLEEGYTYAEYKKAYRKISLAIHPDKNPSRDKEAEQLFKALGQINAILDPQ